MAYTTEKMICGLILVHTQDKNYYSIQDILIDFMLGILLKLLIWIPNQVSCLSSFHLGKN